MNARPRVLRFVAFTVRCAHQPIFLHNSYSFLHNLDCSHCMLEQGKMEHDTHPPAIELHLVPESQEAVVFERRADGSLKLSFTGATEIIFPGQYASESLFQPETGGTTPFTNSSE